MVVKQEKYQTSLDILEHTPDYAILTRFTIRKKIVKDILDDMNEDIINYIKLHVGNLKQKEKEIENEA